MHLNFMIKSSFFDKLTIECEATFKNNSDIEVKVTYEITAMYVIGKFCLKNQYCFSFYAMFSYNTPIGSKMDMISAAKLSMHMLRQMC